MTKQSSPLDDQYQAEFKELAKAAIKRNPGLKKQLRALDRGIQTIKDWRRRFYSAGEAAYQRGDRGLTFIEDGHRHYEELTQDIQTLEALKEILVAPPVMVDETTEEIDLTDLPLFGLRDSARTEAGGC